MSGSLADLSMLDLFRMEVETHVAPLERGLLALESAPASRERVEPLMRAAHSIKGAGRILGLAPVVTLAHAMEDLFVAVGEGRLAILPELIDLLLQGVDVFKRLAAAAPAAIPDWLHDQEAGMASMTEAFRAILSAPATPQPAPATQPPAAMPERTAPTPEAPPPEGSPAQPVVKSKVEARPEEPAPESAVLVATDTLNRLLGLAGECLVATRRLEPMLHDLRGLKAGQVELASHVAAVQGSCSGQARPPGSQAFLERLAAALDRQQTELARHMETFESYWARTEELTTRLYDAAVATRMRPFADGVVAFPRHVRDLARQMGKRITLEVKGESVRVDRDMLTRLEAPLNHLLRNACDHAAESPEERVAAGKPPEVLIRLEAAHRAGMLLITVTDDGRGIDVARIAAKVVEKGLADPDMTASMTEAELLDFLFLPGFSTAGKVTEISGRGVGLDVVHTMVQEVGGTIQVSSRPGLGTTFTLQLPLTLSVIRALLAQVAGEPYAFPLTRLDRLLLPSRDQISHLEGRPVIEVDGQTLGLIPASQALGLHGHEKPPGEPAVVVVSDRLNRYGVVVDRLLGERELVVRPLDPILGKVPNVAAAAILEEGDPVLILDVDDLVRSIDRIVAAGQPEDIAAPGGREAVRPAKRVLVVDDSITVREVERRLLANSGYHVDVAVDGMDGWNRLRGGHYDLVITDVDMPRMNGIELVAHIKGDPALRTLPVMIFSYKDREEDRRRGLEAGANYYLAKSSFHDDTLLGAVADLIGES